MYFNEKSFKLVFDKSLELIEKLFNVPRDIVLSKTSKHNITDMRKMIVLKFYNLKSHDRDNVNTWLADSLNCRHSNIIYWYTKSQDLYNVDKSFKNNYNVFSSNLDSYIKDL